MFGGLPTYALKPGPGCIETHMTLQLVAEIMLGGGGRGRVVLPIVKHEANFILRLNMHRSCGNGSERCLTFTNSLFYLPSRYKVPLILQDTLFLNIRCPLNTGGKNSKYLMNCQNNTQSTGMQLGKGFRWVNMHCKASIPKQNPKWHIGSSSPNGLGFFCLH